MYATINVNVCIRLKGDLISSDVRSIENIDVKSM